MNSAPSSALSSPKILEEVLELITHFNSCQTFSQLEAEIEDRLLPFLDCQSAFYGWTDRDIYQVEWIGGPGVPDEDLPGVQSALSQFPLIHLLRNKYLDTVSVEGDVSSAEFSERMKEFLLENFSSPEEVPEYYRSMQGACVAVSRAENYLIMGVARSKGEPFDAAESDLFQLIFPHLANCFRNLNFRERFAKFYEFMKSLTDTSRAVALVDGDLRILFFNDRFHELFELPLWEKIPEELEKVFSGRDQNKLFQRENSPDHIELPFFTLPQGVFRLTAHPVYPDAGETNPCWHLGLEQASDPYHKMNALSEKAGLTWREMEICCLIHDGLGKDEIGARLGISPHTVRTHLKKVHKKLNVNTRTQLVAYLNQLVHNA